MNAATAVLIILATGTYALKSAGPLLLGDRPLPVRVRRLVDLLPAALLAALCAVSTLSADGALTVDARVVGVAAAAVALWRRLPFVVVIVVATAATALVRAVT